MLVLLSIYWLSAVTASRQNSITYDELAHLTGGYVQWKTNDYRLNPENGTLPQRIAALPLLAGDYHLPPQGPAWQNSDVWEYGRQFLFTSGNPAGRMLLSGRAVIAFCSVLLGLGVYLWSRHLFGRAAGLLSLAAFCFCPTMLSHGALVTSDAVTALLFLSSLTAVWSLAYQVTPARLALSCLSAGLLFCCKASAALILPIAAILATVSVIAPRPIVLAIGPRRTLQTPWSKAGLWCLLALLHALAIWAIIWAFAGFRFSAFTGAGEHQFYGSAEWVEALASNTIPMRAIGWLHARQLLPEGFLYGTAFVLQKAASRVAFLNGQFSVTGWWWFFPYAFMAKTPAGTLVLLTLSAGAIASRLTRPLHGPAGAAFRARLFDALPLLALFVVYGGVSLTSNLNIGHRHLLPIYPVIFIAAGAAWCWRQRLVRALALGCIAWVAVESIAIRPHYLAYFNRIVGGPQQGHKHLVDSSLDWGQALPSLKTWLEQHNPAGAGQKPAYLAYFGTADVRYYGIPESVALLPCEPSQPAEPELPEPLQPGIYCISASILQGPYAFPPGPWTAEAERIYATLTSRSGDPLRPNADALRELGGNDPETQRQALWTFRNFRLARLCAHLRYRKPDAMAGYAILIYHLSEADLRQALLGPPVP